MSLHRIMRRIIPVDVSILSIATMCERGIPEPVAKRLWDKKALWLIVMDKDDISKVRIGQSFFSFHMKYI